MEVLVPFIVMVLVGGLQYPMQTFWAGVAFLVARFLFTVGYNYKLSYRKPGMMLQMMSMLVLLTTSFLSIGQMYVKMN